ncbi:MAG: hypothetical protein K0R50_1357 [Eubacterium sp.]|jgi:hypothetical protein|nr:hypothetical protein [Eubacterium sp.]
MRKRFCLWLSVLVLAVSFAGCGSASKDASSPSMAASEEVAVQYSEAVNNADMAFGGEVGDSVKVTLTGQDETAVSANQGVKGDSSTVQNNQGSLNINQKIIFSGQVDFETLNFDKTRTELSKYMTSIGAYQQSSSIKGGGIGYQGLKSAVFIFRVPKAKYDQSFIDLKKFGTVVFEQSNGQDVTEQYFDTEARLKSLKIQQDRLLELLKKAVKMEDILKIEKELQTTNYEIENLTGTLKKWDCLVEYSTLTVNINEVEQIKPVQPKETDGFLYRISSGFKNSVSGLWNFLQDTIVFLAAALPVLIPLGLIGYALYRIIRKRTIKPEKTSRPLVIPDLSQKNDNTENAIDKKSENSEKPKNP